MPSALQKLIESEDHPGIANWISSSKNDPNSTDTMGLTPLHYAAYFGKTEIVRELLRLGSDPNFISPKYNATPLQWATYCGIKYAPNLNPQLNSTVIELLLQNGATYDILSAVANQDLPQVTSILNQDLSEANSKWMNGYSPLHVNNNVEIGRLLLQAGADINQSSDDGTTPLIKLSGRLQADPKVAMLYIQSGAEVNAQNQSGTTALHGAVRRGHLEIVEALLKAGADKALKNKKGESPLDKALNLRKKQLQEILK